MKNNYYFLYFFFDNIVIRCIRVLSFFAIGILVIINLGNQDLILRVIPLYFLLILQELFIHFKLENSPPQKRVTEEYSHIIECVDFRARAHLEREPDIEKVIHSFEREHEVKFFISLLSISGSNISAEFDEKALLSKSAELVNRLSGKYIHSVDLYAAFLLLADSSNKFLADSDITEEDVLVVLSWVRKQYQLDNKLTHAFSFSGSGVFDFFIYGWSSEVSKYATNFTQNVLSSKRLMPIGREREYDLLVTSLAKSSSSNVLLVGSPGSGKSSLIRELVSDSNEGKLPQISNKIVFKLFPERLISGIQNQGELEERFTLLFSELSHAGNIILFIPNTENIFGGGGMNFDISGSLIEYLKGNKITIIGSTTQEAYQSNIYPKQELRELFEVITVNEADSGTTIFMLLEKAKEFERDYKVNISYDALKKSVELSQSYIVDGTVLPGRAIRLLEDAITYSKTHGEKKITKDNVTGFIQTKTGVLMDKPDEKESASLLNLEEEMHQSIISQNEAVTAIADAMRRVRSGMKHEGKPIASFLFLGSTGVGKTQTAKALARSYFGDEHKMIRLDMSEYQTQDAFDRLLGGGSTQSLVDMVLSTPFSLILLDEFEKANPHVLDLFLQVLDEGRLTDNSGKVASFANTIIIATSNAGSEFIRENYHEDSEHENVRQALLEKVQQSPIFKLKKGASHKCII